MAKGGQAADINLKNTKIGEFDEFFESAKDPLSQSVSWNNELDSMVKKFRKIGQELRTESSADAPESIGDVEVVPGDAGTVSMRVIKNGEEVKKLDKINNEYNKAVQTKIKKINARLKTLQKKEGFADARYAVEEGKVVLVCDEAALKAHEDEAYVTDLKRSLTKFNDRSELMDISLKGPITLGEAVSGLINSVKKFLEEKGQQLKVIVEGGVPKFDGIPESVEDFFPKLLAQGWKLLQQVIDFIQNLAQQIPGLVEKMQELMEQAKEFPGKAREAAQGAGLGGMEIVKAVKAVSNNIKEMGRGPEILKQLAETAKDTGLQIADAATGNKAE